LSWQGETDNGSHTIRLTLTHEEIAEMIGTTRETVSRLFSDFKKKQLVEIKGSSLTIRKRDGLEKLIHS
jgi:CRP/FNR family transcriptional regulator